MATAGSLDRVGTFLAYSICAPQNAGRAVGCAQEEIKRFIAEGVPQEELNEARQGYRQQIEVGLSNDGAVAGMLTRDLFLGRTLKFAEEQLAKVEALQPAAVQAALAKYVPAEKLIIVEAGDLAKAGAGG
jgi:zinc protease